MNEEKENLLTMGALLRECCWVWFVGWGDGQREGRGEVVQESLGFFSWRLRVEATSPCLLDLLPNPWSQQRLSTQPK